MTGKSQEEFDRLRALRRLDVLDTPPEAEFDGLVKAAALVCGVPVSLISLVDADRQWFKANHGLPGVAGTPRSVSFCSHAIQGTDLMEVPDALSDPRFSENPLVLESPNIRFYAGFPLRLKDGEQVGTLCVIDHEPRELTSDQRSILNHLSTVAVQALESRQKARGFVASEARFRALSDASPLGVFGADRDGLCTYTNDRWQQIFGLSREEARGAGWRAAVHREDKARVFAEWQHCAKLSIDFDAEFRIQRADKDTVFVRAVACAVRDEQGALTGFVGSIEDITIRREQERALSKSEWLLNETGLLANVGGWEFDLKQETLVWSDQTCRIHGVKIGYSPGLSEAIDFYAPPARATIRTAVKRAIAEGLSWDLELPLIRADDEPIWVRAVGQVQFENGEAVRLVGAIQDITERVKQRKALEDSNQRMVLATESGGIGVWEFDLNSGVMEMDSQMRQLYAVPTGAKIEISAWWSKRLHPDDAPRIMEAMREALRSHSDYDDEFRIVLPDKRVRHIRAAARVTDSRLGESPRLIGVNWDVTELREIGAELKAQRELLHVTLESIGDAVITTDSDGMVTWLNPVAERMTGWELKQSIQRPIDQIFSIVNEQTGERCENPVMACLAEQKIVGLANHTALISKNGACHGIEDSAAPIRNASGEILGAVLVFHDVTEQRRLSREMSYRATHDPLTGLVNRTEFEVRLRRTLSKSQADRSDHALMVIDLDQFKLVNDACGHAIGDQLLIQVAKLLGDTVRSRDTLARLGGDEFAVILEHCSAETGARVADQICSQMDDFRFVHDDRSFRIGASIGLVPLDQRWADITSLMQAADTSCFAAKEAGRNRVHKWFDTDQLIRLRRGEMQWASRLEQALDEGRFEMHGQRILPLSGDASKVHAEALIRLLDTDGTLIQPGAFLPAAERFHLASRVDRWVLKHALDHLTRLHPKANFEMLCVNLSGQSVGDRAFHRDAIELLVAAGPMVCQRLCLEITETAAVTNLADAAVFIEQARLLGVRVALDDFGSGSSSFGYLKTLNVDMIKIDGQFIRDLISDPLDTATVRCFVDVAGVVGVRTVAEYVEVPEILERVRELGIDYAQGFLIHKPQPIQELMKLAAEIPRLSQEP
ncbi:MAG: EAL domain-containing protein [Burkholderiaceae bacterium]